MIDLAFRHGLRVSELVALRWEQVDLKQGLLHVRRRKNGLPSTHPLRGVELRALRNAPLEGEYPPKPEAVLTQYLISVSVFLSSIFIFSGTP